MTWRELADGVEATDASSFVVVLAGDGSDIKAMLIHALRFADFHEISWPPKPDSE